HIEQVEQQIARHPVIQQLRQRTDLIESRPHLKIHEADRPHNLTAGTLAGPGRITIAPHVFGDRQGTELYVVAHLGADLCGHDGIVHGGLLATLLDEGLARCCFPALPNKIGVTANLNVDYRKPTKANQLVMLKAKTLKVEGRKAWVEGKIVSMDADKEGDTLVQAKALFVEPKYAALM
ncbi:thioesterase family protein, partial [Protomyces lactucae-debilis]